MRTRCYHPRVAVTSPAMRTRALRSALVTGLLASITAFPLASIARPLAARELRTPSRRSPGASEPLAFVVHPTRPATALSFDQAYSLINGAIDSWRSLDGRAVRVRLVLGPAAAARAAGIWLLAGHVPPNVTIERTEQQAADAVADDPSTIAIVTGDTLSPAVRAATVAGVDPVRDPVSYPLRVPAATPPVRVTTAIAFGDIMTSRTVDKKIRASGDFLSPFRDVGGELAGANLAFGNFEGTISHDAHPQPGGTRFVSRPGVVAGFRYAGIDFLSLANNHAGDYGAGTLLETVKYLRDGGIAVAGAGADLAGATAPAVVTRNGIRFAFVSFNAITGTPPAGPAKTGAVRIDMAPWFPFSAASLAVVEDEVRRARAMADVVIVYPHWGLEYHSHPNPDQIRVAHALIDAGADMLIATHPHWVQGAEIYKGHLIAYSLGNFVFDQTWSTETQEGAALSLTFWGSKLVAASFVPVRIADAHRPRFVDYRDGADILARIWSASGSPYRAAA